MPQERKAAPLTEEQVQDRVVLCLVNEVRFCMGENRLTHPIDAEMGLIFGIGSPAFRGGPLHDIDHRGARNILQGLETLRGKWGERFSPAPDLVRAAGENRIRFTG